MDPALIVKIASTAGIISTTSFWAMNYTINYLAFPALLLGDIPKASNLPQSSARFFAPSTDDAYSSRHFLNRQWQEVYWRGVRWGPPSAIISGVSLLTASWFSASGSNEQYLYATAAVAAMSVMPWTLLVLVPVNEELHRGADAQISTAKGNNAEKEAKGNESDVVALIRAWVRYNDVRATMALVATGAAVAALFQ